MKYFFSLLFFALLGRADAQDISGPWSGVLKVPGMDLKLVLNVKSENNQFSATLDSPAQGAMGIPVSFFTYRDSLISFALTNIGAQYGGKMKSDGAFEGIFKQSGQTFPLKFTRGSGEVKHPQTPIPPFAYINEDVEFDNAEAGVRLSGTLTYPKNGSQFPVVILISGSGPQNRDEDVFGHKPFMVLADYLTKNGIAVLRYDDRGVGASTGDFSKATTKDFATDIKAAMAFLKTKTMIDPKRMGLAGHSEGGLIAPMVAAESKEVAFIVMLAGPGLAGDEILTMQNMAVGKAAGASEETLSKIKEINGQVYKIASRPTDTPTCEQELNQYLNEAYANTQQFPSDEQKKSYIALQVKTMSSPWMRYFLSYDPIPALQKVKCPVLALFGEKDMQVPSAENAKAVQKALESGGNKQFEVVQLPGINHLFQECKTGSVSEYESIEQTISPAVLKEVSDWIIKQTK